MITPNKRYSPPINDMFSSHENVRPVRSLIPEDDGPPNIKFKLLTVKNLENPN